jgi:hypothetical protein
LSGLLLIALAALAGAEQSIPPELDALVARARLEGPVTSWCRGEFRPGHPGAYAVAIASGLGGGRYVVLNGDGTIATLAAVTAGADLSCYSADEARALDAEIGRNPIVEGRIAPRWDGTVICAVVDDVTAVCWQYSPDDEAFITVGTWIT